MPEPSSSPARVWLVPLDETAEGVAAALALPMPLGAPGDWLDPDEKHRAGSIRDATERHRWLVSHVALRLLLGAALDVHPADLRVRRAPCARCGGPHGRPRLGDGVPLHFSLSRSGDRALIALRHGLEVGVDVECTVGPERDPSIDIARWTRSEALLKSTGEGLTRDIGSVRLREPRPGHHADDDLAPGTVIVDLDLPGPLRGAVAGFGLSGDEVRVHLPVTERP